MSNNDQIITFYMEGRQEHDGYVLSDQFAALFHDWSSALAETSKGLAEDTVVDWMLVDFSIGSARLLNRAVSQNGIGAAIAQETTRTIIVAMNRGAQGSNLGDILPPRAVEPMERFLRNVNVFHVPMVAAESNGLSARLTGEEVHRPIPATNHQTLGSVEGEVVSVSYAQTPVMRVRQRISGNLVSCYFDRDQFADKADASLRKRVGVRGLLTYNPDRSIKSVHQVSMIYVFPNDDKLPKVGEVAGVDPDFTGSKSSTEWVRLLRDE